MAEPSEQKDEHDTSGPTVGALLQASRQRLGEELTDVASMLRIRLPYLVAIEAGRHQELPGATYAVGCAAFAVGCATYVHTVRIRLTQSI